MSSIVPFEGSPLKLFRTSHRLTYGSTLAELTSLEEMMRIMMDDNQIHSDVIAKLWQVYS